MRRTRAGLARRRPPAKPVLVTPQTSNDPLACLECGGTGKARNGGMCLACWGTGHVARPDRAADNAATEAVGLLVEGRRADRLKEARQNHGKRGSPSLLTLGDMGRARADDLAGVPAGRPRPVTASGLPVHDWKPGGVDSTAFRLGVSKSGLLRAYRTRVVAQFADAKAKWPKYLDGNTVPTAEAAAVFATAGFTDPEPLAKKKEREKAKPRLHLIAVEVGRKPKRKSRQPKVSNRAAARNAPEGQSGS